MALGWISGFSEFCGSFGASFIEHRARIRKRRIGSTKADTDIAAYKAVNEGLKACIPMEDHVTRPGLRHLCTALKKNDHFAAQLAIDANPGPRKRDFCIFLLKSAVCYLCSDDPADLVRAATYTMIACK